MKITAKIKIILLIAILTVSSLEASRDDDFIKKQCQYNVYGNGSTDYIISAKMMGLIGGMLYTLGKEEGEDFIKTANYGTINDKACENALNNTTKYGFEADFKWELIKLISKKYN